MNVELAIQLLNFAILEVERASEVPWARAAVEFPRLKEGEASGAVVLIHGRYYAVEARALKNYLCARDIVGRVCDV